MKDSMIFKYLIYKYCIKVSIIVPVYCIFFLDLVIIPYPTILLFILVMFGSRIYVRLKNKKLTWIESLEESGLYSIFLSEIIYPILFICALLQKL